MQVYRSEGSGRIDLLKTSRKEPEFSGALYHYVQTYLLVVNITDDYQGGKIPPEPTRTTVYVGILLPNSDL